MDIAKSVMDAPVPVPAPELPATPAGSSDSVEAEPGTLSAIVESATVNSETRDAAQLLPS